MSQNTLYYVITWYQHWDKRQYQTRAYNDNHSKFHPIFVSRKHTMSGHPANKAVVCINQCCYCEMHRCRLHPRQWSDTKSAWRHHQMETFSALLALCAGIPELPATTFGKLTNNTKYVTTVFIQKRVWIYQKHHRSIKPHYNDVIIGEMVSQIISITIVSSTIQSGTNQRKH